jgi:hypothetical protein
MELANMVSQAINQCYQAWSLGGGQETKEKQEAVEEHLRAALLAMLVEKYNRLEAVAEKYRLTTLNFFKSPIIPSGRLLRSVKDQHKHFVNMDSKERMAAFNMTEEDEEMISASLLFGLPSAKRSKFAQLSDGFNVHGPNRYLNPKLM